MAVIAPDVTSLPQVLARQRRLRAGATALRFEGADLPYGELERRVDALAALLARGWAVRPGDRVAWLGLNHPAQIVLLFAPAEWEALLADSTPAHLVHDAAHAAAAQALAARARVALHPLEALQATEAHGPPPDAARADAPALLVYTSGTTGGPKAAVHTQAQLLANMALAAQVQELGPADVVLTVLPLFHVGGLCIQTLPALWTGACVLLHARFTPETTFDALASERPSLTLQVPATMKALVEHPHWADADLSCLRALWAGSSLLPAPLVQAFHARGVPVCNVYGATETGPFSIALPPRHAMDHVGSCGWPAPGVEVRLAEVRSGAGELWLRGPNVVQHYWPDRPARHAEGWFHTGDLATQAADGSYTIVGRIKDLIISGGENIHPAEIEAPLAEHPAVLECAAFGVPDPDWGEAVAMAVVLRPGARASDDELRAYLAQRLARYKLPRRWLWLEALPKTALGKVQRQALIALA